MGNEGHTKQVRHYLVFTLSGERFGLPLDLVQRVVHAAAVTRLPKAPQPVRGLINYKGRILPVINMSRRFKLEETELTPSQNFVIVQTPQRGFVLVADTAEGVIAQSIDNIVAPAGIAAGMEFLEGVIKLDNGLMLIPDLENLLTHQEEQVLDALVQKKRKKTKTSAKKTPSQKKE